jgi:hypothetical protein
MDNPHHHSHWIPAQTLQTPGIDPLDGFEAADPTADMPHGRGHHMCKPSAYVCGIADGTGSSTGRSNAPVYPRGLLMPTGSSSLVALTELAEGTGNTSSDMHRHFEWSMAVAMRDTGGDPTNLNDACSRDDWPQWDYPLSGNYTNMPIYGHGTWWNPQMVQKSSAASSYFTTSAMRTERW